MKPSPFKAAILEGIPATLPPERPYDPALNHAPRRKVDLTLQEKKLAIRNALRYIPARHHRVLAREFANELEEYGRIYMYRYKPDYEIRARKLEDFPHRSIQAGAIMLMLSNNLDHAVAQHPDELITYGGNGSVFQNWAQYRLTMKYLAIMSDEQTLVLYSGHPLGLFPSHPEAPRVVVTNGMVIPNYSGRDDYERMNALGVTQYGQMTAGSFMYIGPQGIVHGTTITVMNAARIKFGDEAGMAGRVFVTSGLGGMSGAQPKATVIAGGICVVAEVNPKATATRHAQGWVDEVYDDLERLVNRMERARNEKEAVSLAYRGNVVDLWEYLLDRGIRVELGSDQTSLHNPYAGGYYPAGLGFEEASSMMSEQPGKFREAVHASLIRQVKAINGLCDRGMYFWDYGNAFLLEAGRAGADIFSQGGACRYHSYVEAVMGPLYFDYGFGPFRWV
jgi:urocanate hydratase